MNTEDSSKVLVIDDERSVRENIAAYLEDSEFSVYQAENGRVGMEMFEKMQPDVVLVDIDMPEMNGFEVLVEVKKQSDEIPVVIVSGAGEVTNAIEASRLGAWDFVLKPIHNMAVVEHTIYRVLEHRELLRENREYKEDLEKKVKERTISLELKTTELQDANELLKAEIEERRLAEARIRQAKERSVALRRFSNRISEFNDEARLLETALEELCSNIYLSGASLFHSFKSDQLTECLPGNPPSDFLDKLPTFDFIREVFSNRSEEIIVYNNVPEDSAILEYYQDQQSIPDDVVGSHFAFLRGQSLHHHLFCFHRDALYAPFYNLDIEYMKSMINEINTAYGNIQVISANSWLERRLKSTIPADRQNILLEKHEAPGFELATSVYPSYEIKAEWHYIISAEEETSTLLMSDIPGLGMSDVMYNEMAIELLKDDKKRLRDVQHVLGILNEELQTDFHPNRFLTLNYFILPQNENDIVYSNLGNDVMTLIRFDSDGHVALEPRISPFMQVFMGKSDYAFLQERIPLKAGEAVFGFTKRMAEMVDRHRNEINTVELIHMIHQSMSMSATEIMERIVYYLKDSFPKELQDNDANLIMIKRV